MAFKLLQTFEGLFSGKLYNHRNSSLGNFVAIHLYEDLYALGHSAKFNSRVDPPACVVNAAGSTRGVQSRRGDGTFGTVVPGTTPVRQESLSVQQGMVALTQIGVEVKILAKSQLKQIDRVMTDLVSAAETVKAKNEHAIAVAVVGVNYSERYVSVEGKRQFPIARVAERAAREANEVARRIDQRVRGAFDELLILKFRATNEAPFPFAWLDVAATQADYGAAVVRISDRYEKRF